MAQALAGLRASEARYYMNKYKHEFTVEAAGASKDTIEYVKRIPHCGERDCNTRAVSLHFW